MARSEPLRRAEDPPARRRGGDRRLNSEPLTPDDLRGPAGDRDRLLDEAAASLGRQEPYESVDGWLWRVGVIAAAQVGVLSRAVQRQGYR
jgi:hypothetical protein